MSISRTRLSMVFRRRMLSVAAMTAGAVLARSACALTLALALALNFTDNPRSTRPADSTVASSSTVAEARR